MQTDGMIALSGVVLGIALAGILVALRTEGERYRRIYLTAIFALFGGIAAIPLVVAAAQLLYIFYMPAVLPMLLALPVCIHRYAAIRAGNSPTSFHPWRDGLLPAFALVITLGYWSLPSSAKEAMFVEGVLPPGWLPSLLAIATVATIFVWSCASFGYLLATTRQLRMHREQLKAVYSNTEQYELRWIDGFLTLLIALWAVAALSLVTDNAGAGLLFPEELTFVLTAAMLLVLMGAASSPEAQPPEIAEPLAPETEKPQADKYARSALSDDRAKQIASRIETAMRQDTLYLDANLSLQKLSQHVRTPPNLVSQTLNETLGTTFFDFVAHWRIEAAKPLIEAGNASVLDVALDVGFNSRSTFYKAFKREVGMTPKAFRESRSEPHQGAPSN
ncbi:MAG: helix-turn-helix transcriptional regulator [Pseudomonadota bacterium]